jgi:hypothetical protein
MTDWRTTLAGLARNHLPATIADTYIDLLRPAFGLGRDARGPRVGQVGGLPALPDDVDWPVVGGSGPYAGPTAFLYSIDLGQLPARLDIDLPTAGTLLFFHLDGQFDNSDGWSEEAAADNPGGAPVLYVPAGQPVRSRPAPAGITPFRRIGINAELIGTDPDYNHPVVDLVFDNRDRIFHHPILSVHDEFADRRWAERHRFAFQLGGYALAEQLSPERDLTGDKELFPRAVIGTLLSQFDADYLEFPASARHATAGDYRGYWLIDPQHRDADDFSATTFITQTS